MSSFTPINNRNSLPSFQQMTDAGWNLDNVPTTTNSSASTMSQQSEKKYICSVKGCDKAFLRKNEMQRHIRSVHEKQSYLCGIDGCEKSFRADNLIAHKRRVHNTES